MKFTESQIKAIEDIKNFINDRVKNIHCLSGSPGTGKSYLIKNAIPLLVKNSDYHLEVSATTNKASTVINGKTLCKLYGIILKADLNTGKQEYNTDRAKKLYDRFIIIDEVSMLDATLWRIVNNLSFNCKFLLVGDKYQLPAVGSSIDVFSIYPTSELTEVVRQTDKNFLNQIIKAKWGVLNNYMYYPEDINPIHILGKKDHKYIRDLLSTFTTRDKALAYTNNMSINLANTIRKLQGKSFEFSVGDPVSPKNYCESNSFGSTLYPGQDLVISEISEPYTINIKSKENTYKIEVRNFNFESEMGTFISPVDRDYWNILKKTLAKDKDWKNYYYLSEKLVDLRFNEASTVHCAQGSTYDRVFIDISDISTCRAHSVRARLLYVALSRAKNEVYIYDSRE